MFWIDVVSRIVHVSTAIALIGGSVFTLFVLLPAGKTLSDEAHDSLRTAVGNRWKPFVHLGVLLFLVSGFYNYFRGMEAHKGDGLYHALIGTKMLLAFFVMFVASALVGRSAKLQPMRDSREKWLRILVLVAAIIVTLSGFVKVRGVPITAGPTTIAGEADDATPQ